MYLYKYIYNHCGISPMQQESSDPGIRPSTGVGSALPARDQRRGPPPCFGPSGGRGPGY